MGFKRYQPTFEEKLSAMIGLGLGVLFIGIGVWVRHDINYREATLVKTQGIIVGSVKYREPGTSNSPETYAPIVEFQVNGQPTRFTGFYESYRMSEGRTVLVQYDPDSPETTARIRSPLEGLAPWWAFGMGGAGVVSSVGQLLPIRWSSEKQS